MNFVSALLILTNWKKNSYSSIFVIINCLTKIIHYKSVKVTINAASLVEILIEIGVRYYSLSQWINIIWRLPFISKFWSLLYYFLGIIKNFLLSFISKSLARPKSRIIQWKDTCKLLSSLSKIIWHSSY